jgi:hypothetical protein
MFAIRINDYSNDNTSSTATRSPTPELEYVELEDLPGTIPGVKYIDPGRLSPSSAAELQESQGEDVPFIKSPSFSPTFPAKITIKNEIFSTDTEDSRWARLQTLTEVSAAAAKEAALEGAQRTEAGDQTLFHNLKGEAARQAAIAAATITCAAVNGDQKLTGKDLPNPVRKALDRLFYLQSTKWIPSQNPIDDLEQSESSGWTESSDSQSQETWPSPPDSPLEGDDMNPPSSEYCGEIPDEGGWVVNAIGDTNYYRFLIPHPISGRNIVAPYLRFVWNQMRPEVKATYGKDYQTHSRLIQATPVDYLCPPLTYDQIQVLNPNAPFAGAINAVLRDHCPLDLVAGVQQYRHYKRTQLAIQQVANEMRRKEMKYLEKSIEVLGELENANVLGRILAHLDVIATHLADDPMANLHFANAVRGFQGEIPYSARNPAINPLYNALRPRPNPEELRPRVITRGTKDTPEPHSPLAERRFQMKTGKKLQLLNGRRYPTPMYTAKQCHRCRRWGHIRRTCPGREGVPRK